MCFQTICSLKVNKCVSTIVKNLFQVSVALCQSLFLWAICHSLPTWRRVVQFSIQHRGKEGRKEGGITARFPENLLLKFKFPRGWSLMLLMTSCSIALRHYCTKIHTRIQETSIGQIVITSLSPSLNLIVRLQWHSLRTVVLLEGQTCFALY